jgi:hypothetical protein
MAKSMSPGGGGRFAKLKAALSTRPGVKNPAAVAAAVGRAKFGKAKFQAMASRKRAE